MDRISPTARKWRSPAPRFRGGALRWFIAAAVAAVVLLLAARVAIENAKR
ncbi:MAG: hypothetical protein ACP5VQ_10695 [Phycisphaerae bacterium]